MESKGAAQWSSIIVPSVQEMVKEKMVTTVPPRYVRPDQDKTEVTDGSGLNTEIPIIDMKRLCSSTTMGSEVEKLDFACKEWGFFQVNPQTFYYFANQRSSLFINMSKLHMKISDLFLPSQVSEFTNTLFHFI